MTRRRQHYGSITITKNIETEVDIEIEGSDFEASDLQQLVDEAGVGALDIYAVRDIVNEDDFNAADFVSAMKDLVPDDLTAALKVHGITTDAAPRADDPNLIETVAPTAANIERLVTRAFDADLTPDEQDAGQWPASLADVVVAVGKATTPYNLACAAWDALSNEAKADFIGRLFFRLLTK